MKARKNLKSAGSCFGDTNVVRAEYLLWCSVLFPALLETIFIVRSHVHWSSGRPNTAWHWLATTIMHYVTDTLFRYTLHSVLCIIGRTRWKCKTMQAQKCQSGPAGTGWHYDCCTPVPVYYHSIRFTYPHFSQNNNNFPTWMKNQTQNDTWAESRKANASVPSQVSHLGRQSGNLTIWFSSFNSSPDCPATICSLLFPRL